MISSLAWIPKGVADPNPKRYELSKAERELLEKQGQEDTEISTHEEEEMMEQMDDDDSQGEEKNGQSAADIIAANPVDPSSLPAELRMDDYSDNEDDDNQKDIGNLLIGNEASTGLGIDEYGQVEDDAADFDSDEEEDFEDLADIPDTREFMTSNVQGLEAMSFAGHGEGEFDIEDDGNDSDEDDTNLRPNDALVIVAKTQEDFASLEVTVYEETTGNLFVHHDIPLPAYPLCLAHGTINNEGNAGNFVAVGTFEPGIEIWNCDVLNALEPTVILGGEDTSEADAQWAKNMGKKGKARPNMNKRNGLRAGSHTDAVMSLSWNSVHRQVLASGSADKTVKLWDVTKSDDQNGGVAATLTHHSDKVQALEWHPSEGTILATGAYDRTVAIVDARSPNAAKKVKLPADCEALAWDPHQSHLLTAASEDGSVICWDVRNFDTKKPYWSFISHELGCSDIAYNPNIPGMLSTCSVDKTVALWDTQNAGPDMHPFSCGNKDMNVGRLYTTAFYQSSPWLLGCGGSGNQLALWNLASEKAFKKRFADRLNGSVSAQVDGSEENKEPDFEAMMAASDKASTQVKKNSNGKKKKGKKKAHKKR